MLRGDAFAYELRDVHGASRAVAYLTLAACPYVLFTALLTPGIDLPGVIAVVAVSMLMGVAGLICWRWPGIFPRLFWFGAPLVATLSISGLNLATSDASTGAQLFYLWPILFAANFLSRRVVYANLLIVFAGHAATVFSILNFQRAAADWTAMVLAMTMSAFVVLSLRRRADKLRDVLEQQAHADHLTGLANRRHFDEALLREGESARRTDATLALITVDLDHFKAINDTFGHTEGDRVLQAVATAMRTVVGDSGLAARLGGDEFVILMRVGRRAAVGVAEALRAAVAARTDLPGGPPGLSIGIAVLPGDVSTVQDLVAASDAALYDAKTSGRGRLSVAGARQNVDQMPSFAPDPLVPDQRF
ncbi:GGDEF domain-containing protein [Actinoplanes friuliensis]|uniref:GGDEF domain-containing protein n=1 Tax=Actinoplanes friuliensis TaxID=196914 RepID=UPI000694EB7B|nr:GGDEF domain-containing protein [Actinoplanes friuliensis]